MYNIFIIDSNILFREGLANLLQNENGIKVVGEAGSISEAVVRLPDAAPDLTLVDENLADMDDLNGIRILRMQRPQMQVVLMSAHCSEEALIYAARNGARGYILKNHSMSKFMAAIRALERGEAVIPRSMVGKLLDELSRTAAPIVEQEGLETLTQREVEVLRELGRGSSNRQIAVQLAIAENTVKVHVHNILEKLNLRNRRQAANFARCQDLTQAKISRSITFEIGSIVTSKYY